MCAPMDVLNAQQQLFQARDLQQARYNTILAQLRLKAASGRLQEEDLAEVNRLLAKRNMSAPPVDGCESPILARRLKVFVSKHLASIDFPF